MIGELQRVDLRQVCQRQALDFITYVDENLHVLKDAVDIMLCGAERQHSAGALFFV